MKSAALSRQHGLARAGVNGAGHTK